VVYLKPPFGAPSMCCNISAATLIAWAISNHRLVSFADGQVTFRWARFPPDGNKQKLLPLSVNEFLSRFLLHILPQGFRAHP